MAFSTTAPAVEVSSSESSSSLLRLATFNVHQWEDARGVDNIERVAQLVKARSPDILCLQESSRTGQELFMRQVPYLKHSVRFGGCAIMSKYKLTEYHGKGESHRRFQRARHVTAEIRMRDDSDPIYVSSIHLDHRFEPYRMDEEKEIHEKLRHLFDSGCQQVWAGDFNALTREDYDKERWDEIAEVRSLNSWESPQTELTGKVRKERGFKDCWELAARPGPVKTCRFDTRIDYVFASASFLGAHPLQQVTHVDDRASDHNMVVTDFNLL